MKTVRDEYGYGVSVGEVGIEVEIEGDRAFPNPPGDWIATTDGSLRGHSIEYVSAQPINPKDIDEHLRRLDKRIKNEGVKIQQSFRAGVHVHINVREFTMEEIANFALLYYIFDHAFARFCGSNREGNLFCLRLEDAEAPLAFLITALRKGNTAIFRTDNIRYGAVNFAAISRHGSLEFRALETTPDFSRIAIWANMLYNMREYAATHHRNKFGDDFSLLGPEGFLEAVVGRDLAKHFFYDDFVRDTILGMRRVQHAFYV